MVKCSLLSRLRTITLPLLLMPIRTEGLVTLECQDVNMRNNVPFCLDSDYRKNILPSTNIPMNITVFAKVKDIIEVNDDQATVTLTTFLGISWIESRMKLIPNASSWIFDDDTKWGKWSHLNPKWLDYLWRPDVDIINLKGKV